MRPLHVIPDLGTPDLDAARAFYADYLGLEEQDLGLDWVRRFLVPGCGEEGAVQLVTRDATSPEDAAMTVKVDDVDEAWAEARRRGYEIVHPLTTEAWGIRRFFVRAPGGAVVNIAQHREATG